MKEQIDNLIAALHVEWNVNDNKPITNQQAEILDNLHQASRLFTEEV